MIIRLLDIIISLVLILILLIPSVAIFFLIAFESKGGGLFIQERTGKLGKIFLIFKFRTMFQSKGDRSLLTVGEQNGITPIGKFLRKYRLDEIPQLFNILIGDMSFVGPRPEVPKYTAYYSMKQLEVLSIKPGLTDFASIVYKDEASILKNVSDVEAFYIKQIIPRKIRLNKLYICNMGVCSYFYVIFLTLKRIVS